MSEGERAVLASALSGAGCSVLYRPYLQKYPTLPASACALLPSIGFLAMLAAGERVLNALPRFSTGGWTAVVFIGVRSELDYYR